MRIVYFDTETTGVKPEEDKIIELALIIYKDGRLIEEYDHFIQIHEKLSKKIMCNLQPDNVWVAHNTQFDLLFIYNLLKEYYPEDEIIEKLSQVKWLDTLTIFKDRAGYPHRLENMVEHYTLKDVRFHRAIDDARALKECLRELKLERNDIKEYVNLFGFHPKYGVTGKQFPFITYAKQPYFKGLKYYRNILPKTINEKE